jgi:hypothetical protein
LKISVDIKLSGWLIGGFILFTVIGTISHELGHFIAARFLGYDASINYGYTFYEDVVDPRHAFIITWCGPLQTMLTGTIGFLVLLFYKNNFYAAAKLNARQWLIIFVSLFWLRELFNFVQVMIRYFMTGALPVNNDEISLAVQLNLPELSILIPAAIIASILLLFVIFKIIPVQQRLSFIVSGLIGGSLGFYVWFRLVGPVIMP